MFKTSAFMPDPEPFCVPYKAIFDRGKSEKRADNE